MTHPLSGAEMVALWEGYRRRKATDDPDDEQAYEDRCQMMDRILAASTAAPEGIAIKLKILLMQECIVDEDCAKGMIRDLEAAAGQLTEEVARRL